VLHRELAHQRDVALGDTEVAGIDGERTRGFEERIQQRDHMVRGAREVDDIGGDRECMIRKSLHPQNPRVVTVRHGALIEVIADDVRSPIRREVLAQHAAAGVDEGEQRVECASEVDRLTIGNEFAPMAVNRESAEDEHRRRIGRVHWPEVYATVFFATSAQRNHVRRISIFRRSSLRERTQWETRSPRATRRRRLRNSLGCSPASPRPALRTTRGWRALSIGDALEDVA